MKKILFLTALSFWLITSCEQGEILPIGSEATQSIASRASANKVDICHYSEDENTWKVISVSQNAVSAHMAHGDAQDLDGDGYFGGENGCTAIDCDDSDASVNPGAEEIPYDGIDNDCDPSTLDDDLDEDGFTNDQDCDDNDPTINPDATEECSDGVDNNCDGLVDDEDTDTCGVSAEIGDMVEGGIVFYVLETPTDLNGDGIPDQGLVVSQVDLGGFGAPWGNFQEAGCFDANISGADGTAIGTGKQNTDDILAACSNSPSNTAANIARSYNGGGHTDWFLPSQDELFEIWKTLADSDGNGTNTGPADPNNLGGFANTYYWTSSEFQGPFNAFWQHLGNGSQWYTSKNFTFRVRAVRAF